MLWSLCTIGLLASLDAAVQQPALCNYYPGRPQFHILGTFADTTNRSTVHINDVNAVFQYKGVYHVMMQVQMYAWGHLVSKDLVHWKRLPDALVPSEHYDKGGTWDGSLSIVDGGLPLIMYDCVPGGNNTIQKAEIVVANATGGAGAGAGRRGVGGADAAVGDPPVIGVARPSDPSDPELTNWTKDLRNPTVFSGPQLFAGPSAMWHDNSTGKWNLIMADGNVAARFEAAAGMVDGFHTWNLANNDFYPIPGGGGALFVPIPFATAVDAAAVPYTHMLQVDAWGLKIPGMATFILGKYSAETGNFTNTTPVAEMQILDGGREFWFTELGYVDGGSRLLQIGCVSNTGGGYTQLSVMRHITWDPVLKLLLSNPVKEQEELRGAKLFSQGQTSVTRPPNGTEAIARLFEVLPATQTPTLDLNVTLTIPATPAGATSPPLFGVSVLDPPNITYVGKDQGAAISFRVDATRNVSMTLTFHGFTNYGKVFPLAPGQTEIDLRILVDNTVVESFASGGRGVVTSTGRGKGTAIHAFSVGSDLQVVGAEGYAVECGWS